MSDARRYAVWPDPRSRSLKGSRPSVPHGTNFYVPVLLVFVAMCSVFWLFWLSYQYLPSDWLDNWQIVPIPQHMTSTRSAILLYNRVGACIGRWRWQTPLRKPNRGEGIISRKPRPKNACDFLGLLYCFIVLLCICVVSCPYVIYYPTVIVRYSLFVLKVPLNPKQTNNFLQRSSKILSSCNIKTTPIKNELLPYNWHKPSMSAWLFSQLWKGFMMKYVKKSWSLWFCTTTFQNYY